MFDFTITDCNWSSDWNCHEVGFPDVDVVGLYPKEVPSGTANFYIDISSGEVLDVWIDEE